MRHLSSVLTGLKRSIHAAGSRQSRPPPDDEGGREAADELAREVTKKELIRRSSGSGAVSGDSSKCFVSMFSRRGEKGVNQDCFMVWEEFGCQEDMIFCGIFDGHGPWGHFVSKRVRETLALSLLCSWQETLALNHITADDKSIPRFDIWERSFIGGCTAVDEELGRNRSFDSFCSGTTSLSIIKEGELMVLANVGDSRAVLATMSDDGCLIPVQLTIDLKPNLPQEAERITRCKGLVFCLPDEPGVHRVWSPDGEKPGLAMSRAFGDYCVKDYGLISVPEVTQRSITDRDLFIILATDGVWDVIPNQEAVRIVSEQGGERAKSAKRLVESAVREWKKKRRGIAVDDCSAICLFFHP